MNSKFIVIEGLEGAGKTTTRDTVVAVLRAQGINDIVFTREPGGTPLAEKLRDLIKQGIDGEVLTDKAEVLMLYAARVQLVENVIKPALARDSWVVGDRHDLSSQAYQGGGRGIDSQLMASLRDTVLGEFRPDLTLYLDLPPAVGLARAGLAPAGLAPTGLAPVGSAQAGLAPAASAMGTRYPSGRKANARSVYRRRGA